MEILWVKCLDVQKLNIQKESSFERVLPCKEFDGFSVQIQSVYKFVSEYIVTSTWFA